MLIALHSFVHLYYQLEKNLAIYKEKSFAETIRWRTRNKSINAIHGRTAEIMRSAMMRKSHNSGPKPFI